MVQIKEFVLAEIFVAYSKSGPTGLAGWGRPGGDPECTRLPPSGPISPLK